ncbi:hypothetical protein POM88_026328 [Heracleum sosnowskyi]|uniref:Uncharacterized protein n=1 Tax=Heracleum sosnowskyi TaxID=360622 RepID=A0AAD8I5L6_9APIA|nr:hypothetical protein POM88_026328 [Heracleum sosnowskyi]
MCLIRVVNGKHSVGRRHSSLLKSVVTEIYFRKISYQAEVNAGKSCGGEAIEGWLSGLAVWSDEISTRNRFLESNGFTGSVTFLSNLPLSDLDIQDNHSSGVIPEMFESIENLRGRRLRHLEGNHSSWQSLPVSTAIYRVLFHCSRG